MRCPKFQLPILYEKADFIVFNGTFVFIAQPFTNIAIVHPQFTISGRIEFPLHFKFTIYNISSQPFPIFHRRNKHNFRAIHCPRDNTPQRESIC